MNASKVTVFPRREPPVILVVEDDVITRSLVSDELRLGGFKVLEAASTDDAVAVLDTMRVDLLFIAIRLPGAHNGLDLARLVRARAIPAKLILASGMEDEALSLPKEEELGPFLRKPYQVSQVVELVSHSLNWSEPADK